MPEGSTTNIALFGLIGAIVAAAPGMLGVLTAWLEVSAGLNADESLEQRREQARTRFDRLMQINEGDIERRDVETAERTKVSKTSNLSFYIYSGFFFAMLLGTAVDDEDNFSLEQFMREMAGDGGVVILLFGIPWIFLFVKYLRARRRRV